MVETWRFKSGWGIEVEIATIPRAFLESHTFTSQMADAARKWIEKRGYLIRETWDCTRIHKYGLPHEIVEARVAAEIEFNSGYACLCYAAMLLYRRLKRDKVIA